MMTFLRPRLRAPASAVALGTVLAIVFGVSQGWVVAVITEGVFVAMAAGYYVWSGKDTDVGAVIGHRPDERQVSLLMKVTALQGKVLSAAAAIVFVIATVGRATIWPKVAIWPFAIPVVVAGLSGLAGWVIYREHGEADDDDEDAGRRVPVSPGRR
jgi:hypothetical protein